MKFQTKFLKFHGELKNKFLTIKHDFQIDKLFHSFISENEFVQLPRNEITNLKQVFLQNNSAFYKDEDLITTRFTQS